LARSQFLRSTVGLSVVVGALCMWAAARAQDIMPIIDEVSAAGVTASASVGAHLPTDTIDNDLATYWSANGDGQWVRYDLGAIRIVSHVKIAVYQGNTRRVRFNLQLSDDGTVWRTVIANGSSSGTTNNEETYNFADQPARYVRYVGHGANLNGGGWTWWTSLTEVSLFAVVGYSGTPTPEPQAAEVPLNATSVTASASDGNLPANVVDNKLTTRWSANGDGQWLRIDLGHERTVSHVSIGVYNGDTRRNIFDLQVSLDGVSWTTVWSGDSGGLTREEEPFDFPDTRARWVRYVGHMNDVNTFNSVTEVSVFAFP